MIGRRSCEVPRERSDWPTLEKARTCLADELDAKESGLIGARDQSSWTVGYGWNGYDFFLTILMPFFSVVIVLRMISVSQCHCMSAVFSVIILMQLSEFDIER